MLYKDSANEKNNQKNLGTIKSSNLCTEIMEYTDKDEVAVCNLASISLPRFIVKKEKEDKPSYDFESLLKIAKIITANLNKVIDLNYYPIEQARYSNLKNRPIGIGVQGLADTYIQMGMAFEDQEALELNEKIFETIYYGAVEASIELAIKDGPYQSYKNSPTSQGLL